MENFDEHIDALIARHLASETPSDEDVALRTWVEKSPENRRYFADLQAIWKNAPAGRPAPPRTVDTEAALGKVKSQLRGGSQLRSLVLRTGYLWRAAAAVALVFAAVYFLWLRTEPAAPTVIAATDATLTDTLADGSLITLSPQSGLALAAGFNARERRLRLHGEAYFEVKPDTTRPFIVEVEELEVRVVGTAFRVDNSSIAASVTVVVAEGKVRVSARGQSLMLLAGEAAQYDKTKGSLMRIDLQQTPASENRVLRFDATPLREVVQQFEKVYGLKIILKNKNLENCPLTARYNNLPPERVLNLIAESFSLRLSKTENGEYVLDGAGCGE
jgi:transmembrane sensor